MRKLAFALSVGFLGMAAGCDSAAVGGSGQLQLTWEIRDGSATGPLANCAAGEEVHVTAGGITDIFPCGPMSGLTGLIPSGDYAVQIDLVLSGTIESTTTITAPVRNRAIFDLGHIVFVIASSPGTVQFTWEIRVNGAAGTCAANETITFDFGGGLTFANVACAPMAANLTQVPAGSYGVVASLLMGSTVESTTNPISVTVPSGGTVDGGHIIFNVTMLR